MKDIIELAHEAGFHKWYTMPEEHPDHVAIVERFAALVLAEALAEQPAQQEPVAWGMMNDDGAIYDCITPEEHARCEGEYTVPLYAAPQPAINAALVRAEALEEAAVVANDFLTKGRSPLGRSVAAAIRALKEQT